MSFMFTLNVFSPSRGTQKTETEVLDPAIVKVRDVIPTDRVRDVVVTPEMIYYHLSRMSHHHWRRLNRRACIEYR